MPSISEQALWEVLVHANAEIGGEYVIQAGNLVSFDTDLLGSHGYSVDISCAWLTSDGATSDEQRRIYALAQAQVHHNAAELRPGRLFSDMARSAYQLPPQFVPRMNRAIAHGFWQCNEYP